MDLFGRKAQIEVAILKERLARRDADFVLALSLLKKKNETPPVVVYPPRSTTPLHMSEEEEDVTFARDMDLMGKEEAEDILRQLEFENSVIQFEYPDPLA